jgi:predicted unusual protein kinase regulating ubiquinone biosynthesis (AarF/ABC1/UbiB family)
VEPARAQAPRALAVRRRSGRFRLRTLGIEPVARLVACGLAVAADALWVALRAPFSTAGAREARRVAWRERTACRLAATLGALRGTFVKAAQFAAHRPDVLPAGATRALARLRDEVPPLRFEIVRRAVESELGAPLERLFAEFEPVPLAAASVAQVHRARLPGGEPVAVKVQYPWLERALPGDLALVRATLALAARLGGLRSLDRVRLFDEFAAGLREELDFEREAETAREIARNLAGDPQIVVPRVVASHSSRRVLTMGLVPAVRITDAAGLARLRVAPRALVEIVARAYAKQIFVDGLFHADPHPGNLFVIDEPGAGEHPRVLFVDFGLSRRLDPALRRELRQGLHALVRRDLDAFLAGMDRMGVIGAGCHARVRAAVAGMFERIAARGGALGLAGSGALALKDEAKALLWSTPGLQLPNDLLLFAKTLSYVFGLARELDPEADAMRTALPYLLRFLAQGDAAA